MPKGVRGSGTPAYVSTKPQFRAMCKDITNFVKANYKDLRREAPTEIGVIMLDNEKLLDHISTHSFDHSEVKRKLIAQVYALSYKKDYMTNILKVKLGLFVSFGGHKYEVRINLQYEND